MFKELWDKRPGVLACTVVHGACCASLRQCKGCPVTWWSNPMPLGRALVQQVLKCYWSKEKADCYSCTVGCLTYPFGNVLCNRVEHTAPGAHHLLCFLHRSPINNCVISINIAVCWILCSCLSEREALFCCSYTPSKGSQDHSEILWYCWLLGWLYEWTTSSP